MTVTEPSALETSGDTFDLRRVTWVLDDLALDRLLAVIDMSAEVTFDLETTGLDEHAPGAKVVLASFTFPTGDTWLLPLHHPESPWLGRWKQVLLLTTRALREKFLIAHNGKFDCRWLYVFTGVDLAPWLAWDTRMSSHLLDENESTKLKVRAAATFPGLERWDDFDLTYDGAALDVSLMDLGYYAARDTYWTWRLAEAHRREMFLHEDTRDDEPLDPDEITDARLGRLATWCVMPTTRTLTAVEQRGIRFDVPWVRQQVEEHQEAADRLYRALSHRYDHVSDLDPDHASFSPSSLWFQRWTEQAVSVGDLRVGALTKTGRAQWNKSVLVRLAAEDGDDSVAGMLLEYRNHTKRLEYLRSWLAQGGESGVIHANYNAGSVVTGRLSSSGPNMQQVTKSLRPAFIPRDGYYMADLDYSQIELRVAAQMSGSEPMLRAYREGWDLHKMVASTITGKPLDMITADERQKGKAANFGFLYGQTAYGFQFYAEEAYGVSMSTEQAEDAYRGFFDQWEGMMAWHQRTVARAHRALQVVSPIGRVRRMPNIYPGQNGWSDPEKQAINAPVQGFASDLMQIAAASITGMIPGHEPVEGVHIVATVHDSIVVEVLQDRWEERLRECMSRMTDLDDVLARMDCTLDVPLAVEAAVGTRWGYSDIGEIAA